MKQIFVIFLFFGFSNGWVVKNDSIDFSKCKVHYSRSETTYKVFYTIPEEARAEDKLLDFHFSVLTRSDAHILLSPSSSLHKDDPVYEIVLGAGGNTFADIRRMQKSSVRATVRVKGLVSAVDIHSFWIHILKDGLVEIGREGEELAFLSWQDEDPLPLLYFSFCTWTGVEAKWFFDCPMNHSSNSEMVPPVLTDLEKLRKDLLSEYNPYVRPVLRPDDLTIVNMDIQSIFVYLDEYKSTLEVQGTMTLDWKDEKMIWEPLDYGNISNSHVFSTEVWQPDIVTENGVNIKEKIYEKTMMIVDHTGQVNWKPTFKTFTWCNLKNFTQWPSEVYKCDIVFAFLKDREEMHLNFNHSDFAERLKQFSSEWEILEVDTKDSYGWGTTGTDDSPMLILTLTLRRNSKMYSAIFLTPFLVISISLFSTFFVSPFGHLKISLGCCQLILTSLLMIAINLIIPAHPDSVPYLVHLYSFTLIAITISIGISIIVINLSRMRANSPAPRFLYKFFTSSFTAILLLPTKKIGKEYGKLNEVSTRKLTSAELWVLLGITIDRVAFLVYLGLFSYALTLHL